MTLCTKLRILTPTNPETVWRAAMAGLGATDPITEEWTGASFVNCPPAKNWQGIHSRMTVPGQGLDAWVILRWGTDGPCHPYPDDGGPAYALAISFDTAYSGTSQRGETCDELHARLIGTVLDALPDWIDYAWQNEYTGTWTHGERPGQTISTTR